MPDPLEPVICALTGSTTETVGTFRYDVPGDTWWWSPAVYRIHGFEPGEIVPTTALINAHHHPANPADPITTAIRAGTPFCSRHRILDTRQRVHTVIILGQGIPDSDGSINEIRGYIIDITDTPDRDPVQATQAIERATSRATIEQAKGALMISYGIDDTAAFQVLRRHSQNTNIKLRDIAALITDHIANPHLAHLPAAARITHILRHLTHLEKLTAPRTPRQRAVQHADERISV